MSARASNATYPRVAELHANEVIALQKWLRKVPQREALKNGVSLRIEYSNASGIGTGVTAILGELQTDITDYNLW